MKTNERFLWALEVLDLQPDDTILEIGCGTGILVEQMAAKLKKGEITGIDRSTAMIQRATKRNAALVASGKVKFMIGECAELKSGKVNYDKILAFNVSLFWKNTGHELELIRELLHPKGLLFVFYQAPFEINIQAAKPVKELLVKKGFSIVSTAFKKLKPTSAFCVIAKWKE